MAFEPESKEKRYGGFIIPGRRKARMGKSLRGSQEQRKKQYDRILDDGQSGEKMKWGLITI